MHTFLLNHYQMHTFLLNHYQMHIFLLKGKISNKWIYC